jgi:hypothetical protein
VKKVKALWAKIPRGFRKETVRVAGVFATTFVATAAPAIPYVLGQVNVGKVPSLSSIHAVVTASFAAALRAAVPVARVALVKAAYKIVAHVEANTPAPVNYPAPDAAAVKAAE